MTIIVCPLHDLEAIAHVRSPSHILSLISPSAEATGFDQVAPNHLELRFNDIAEPRDGLIDPTHEHVRAILDFGSAGLNLGPLVIHCWAGVSRSTAAAYMLGCQQHGISAAHNMAVYLRHLAPYATPNPLMIAHADEILDAKGAMVDAIRSIGRGCDTRWGSAFEF